MSASKEYVVGSAAFRVIGRGDQNRAGVLRFRQFSFRGIEKMQNEFKLVCAALNLRRMASMTVFLGIQQLQMYRFRMNGYIPKSQSGGSLQSAFEFSFFATAKLDALLIDGIHQAGDCATPFPAEIPGTTDYRIRSTEQVAVP